MFTSPCRTIRAGLQIAIVLAAVFYALDLFRKFFDLTIYGEQLLAPCLGAALAVTFLDLVIRAETRRVIPHALYLVAAGLAVAASVYLALSYPRLSMLATMLPRDGLIAGAILLVLLLEGLRLAAGLGILVVVLAFLSYGFLGHLYPGQFEARYTSPAELAVYLSIDANGMLGVALQVAVVVVVPYVLFGQMLSRLGAADFFNDAAMSVMGRYRGGTAKVAVAASALFGSISGSAVGNVVGTGVVTIPMMKRAGVPGRYAGAIEAVASTGGQLVPPVMGATAFIMADFLGVSYGKVMLAAFLPGVLYYLALFLHVDLLAAKDGVTSVDKADLPSGKATLRGGWYFLLPFAALFYLLFAKHMRPEMAAMWAAAILLTGHLIFGYKGRRIGLAALPGVVAGAGGAATQLIIVCAGAGVIIGVLNLSGLAFNLTMHIIGAAGGSLLLLALITAVISIVLGMGMPTVGVYILLATLVVPALIEAGIPDMAAHLFVFYFGLMSMITPPVALASFAAANIAQASAWQTSWASIRLGWTAFIVPFLFLFAPALLLEGDPVTVGWAALTALAGIYGVTVGMVGFNCVRLGPATRLGFVAAGFALLIPSELFNGALVLNLVGLVVLATALVLCQVRRRRQGRT
ncbi:TRAP transporter permease [Actibacterium sp. D379-3]